MMDRRSLLASGMALFAIELAMIGPQAVIPPDLTMNQKILCSTVAHLHELVLRNPTGRMGGPEVAAVYKAAFGHQGTDYVAIEEVVRSLPLEEVESAGTAQDIADLVEFYVEPALVARAEAGQEAA